jgi:membrane-bound metal-dependent hydrolase YbcI (DUF457 family)
MPLTPFHAGYALLIKRAYPRLDFAALTIGALVPDMEQLFWTALGRFPNRLVTHSPLGVVTIDLALTWLMVGLLGLIRIERLGIEGFRQACPPPLFMASALIGSSSHILLDVTNHIYNPLLWPANDPYIPSPLIMALGEPVTQLLVQGVSLLVFFWTLRLPLQAAHSGLLQLVKDPKAALQTITRYYHELS